MSKKISVIIPIYNGERYLERAIDSVLRQEDFAATDLEVLLLDDGSTDGSHEIMRHYEEAYPDIVKALSHKNMGVAKTRNKGIREATGQYVTFLDHDDYFDPDYCATFYRAIHDTSYAFIGGGYRRVATNGEVLKSVTLKNQGWSKYMNVGICGKLHDTEFLRKNRIKFWNNEIGEDIIFNMTELNKASKSATIPYVGYNYLYNQQSATSMALQGLKKNRGWILALLQNLRSLDTHDGFYRYFVIKTTIYLLLSGGSGSTKQEFNEAYSEFTKWLDKAYPGWWHDRHVLTSVFEGEAVTTWLSVSAFVLLHRFRLMRLFAKAYCKG